MNQQRVWWKYPEGYYERDFFPWYTILRRTLCTPIILVGFGLLYLGIALAGGVGEAERVRNWLW
jgi:hypothetical protein